jgi:hypothetical protein
MNVSVLLKVAVRKNLDPNLDAMGALVQFIDITVFPETLKEKLSSSFKCTTKFSN